MSIRYRLCPVSAKRLAMIEADVDLVNDLDEEAVPDLLDLGSEGFELDAILLFTGDKIVRDAVFAQTGRDLAGKGEGVRVHTPERTAEISQALAKLPADAVALHYDKARQALGKRLPGGKASVELYAMLFDRLRRLYAKARAEKSGMLTFMA